MSTGLTIDQLLYTLGLRLNVDGQGNFLTGVPPNPIPVDPISKERIPYAVTQELNGSRESSEHGGGQLRAIQVLVSIYGFALTAAGRQSCVIVLAHLRARAHEVNRHPGIRVIECIAEDDSGVRAELASGQHFASIRYVLTYHQAPSQ